MMIEPFARIVLPALVLIGSLAAVPATADNYMMSAEVGGVRIEGKPLFYSRDIVQLLLRDGRMFEFDPSDAANFRKTSPRFRSYTASEVRSRLAAELGREFDITGTGHYLVAHPRGQKDLWAGRFEDLYRDFVHYFSIRGFRLHKPEFPLIAVVWHSKKDFQRHAVRSGAKIDSNVLGYYSPITNRVHLYDATAGRGTEAGKAWQRNAATIIHEVTHQTAFNTGVHTRFANTPTWVAEGLGTLFEARGIYDSRTYRNRRDRINGNLLAGYQQSADQFGAKTLVDMISSDRMFDRSTARAYLQAWALTFYLTETQPRRYSQYLTRIADRQPGEPYPVAARLGDFTAVFGKNFRLHESHFARFMEDLK